MDLRRFHRMTYTAPALLTCNNLTYEGRLGNISLQGALVSANEGLMVTPGDRCTVEIHPEDAEKPLLMYAEVIHSFYSMVGVKFLLTEEEEERLYLLLQGITPEPDKLKHEWEHVLHGDGQQGESSA